jgi:excisionase family DNA binding protein
VKTIPLSAFGLMTVREVAAYHRVSLNTVGLWILSGKLPAVPVSRGFVVRRADCERFVKPPMGRPLGAKNGVEGVEERPAPRVAPVLIPRSQFGLMTVAQVALYHKRRVHAVWVWLARGLLPAVALDRGVFVRRSDCEAFWPPKSGGGGRRRRVAPAGKMTAMDVAEYHKTTNRTVARWVAVGRLPAVVTPDGYLVRRAHCEAFKKPTPGRPRGRKTRIGKRKSREG